MWLAMLIIFFNGTHWKIFILNILLFYLLRSILYISLCGLIFFTLFHWMLWRLLLFNFINLFNSFDINIFTTSCNFQIDNLSWVFVNLRLKNTLFFLLFILNFFCCPWLIIVIWRPGIRFFLQTSFSFYLIIINLWLKSAAL
jgi:hypothetical protein